MQLVTKVNYLNIGLMLLSCIAAYMLPFQLFLFSYAILGPLHYLTEIGWLHQKGYFTSGKKDYLWLLFLAAVLSCLYLVNHFIINSKYFYELIMEAGFNPRTTSAKLTMYIGYLIIMAFVAALSTIVFNKNVYKLLFTLVVSGLIMLAASQLNPIIVIASILLPTVIHTTVFMLLFIFYGSLKSRSISGYLSSGLYVLFCILFFVYDPGITLGTKESVIAKYANSGFLAVNAVVMDITNWRELISNSASNGLLSSKLGMQIQQFIAFSYTYHYLNWFSKTHVINWHKVPKNWLVITGVLWVLSVSLYIYDFKIGLVALFFLSMLHVFVEFPLNYRSVFGIGQELLAISKGNKK